jgi:hypothetical protein
VQASIQEQQVPKQQVVPAQQQAVRLQERQLIAAVAAAEVFLLLANL